MDEVRLKEIKIEVTYKCPLSCVHCSSNASEENTATISKEKCMEIISQAIDMGVESIAFSGGEPLIWDGLEQAVLFCSTNKVHTTIYTSGNCLNAAEKFKQLSEARLEKAIFSIYSPIEKEHVRITRKRNSFKNTLDAIRICNDYGIIPEIHFVALASNYHRLANIVDLAKNIGVNTVSVLRFVPQGRGVLIEQRDTLSKKQNLELIHIIKSIRKTGYELRTGSPFNVLLLNDKPKCMAATDRMIIAPDLKIYPCDAFKQIEASEISNQVTASDLLNHTLKDCWNCSSYLNSVRMSISTMPNEPCKSCTQYKSCKSGCLAQKFLKYKTLTPNCDPACLRTGGLS